MYPESKNSLVSLVTRFFFWPNVKSDSIEKIRDTLEEKCYTDNKYMYYLYLFVTLQFILCFT